MQILFNFFKALGDNILIYTKSVFFKNQNWVCHGGKLKYKPINVEDLIAGKIDYELDEYIAPISH